jgi:hypothetical protein
MMQGREALLVDNGTIAVLERPLVDFAHNACSKCCTLLLLFTKTFKLFDM